MALLSLLQNTSVPALLTADYTTNRYAAAGVGTSVATALPGFSFSNSTGGYSLDGSTYFGVNYQPYSTNMAGIGTWYPFGGSSASISSTPAPDGSLTATNINLSGGAEWYCGYQTNPIPSGAVVTMSCWLRSATGTAPVQFDYTGSGDDYNPSIFTVDTTWRRYTWTHTTTFASGVFAFAAGGSASNFLAWGPQIELGSTATAYAPVAGTTYTSAPRITSAGLLVEPSSTNWFWPSQTPPLVTATDRAGGATVAAASITAPDGTSTAQTITSDTSYGFHGMGITVPTAGVTTITGSFYFKGNTNPFLKFRLNANDGNSCQAYFDTSGANATTFYNTGTITNNSFQLISLPNGWYRAILTCTWPNATTGPALVVGFCNGFGNDYYTGSASDKITVWGFQYELGTTTATSLIPTTTAAVTRAADVATQTYTGTLNNVRVTTAGLGDMVYPAAGVTNYLPASTNIANTSFWGSYAGASATTSAIAAPDGSLSAAQITLSGGFGVGGPLWYMLGTSALAASTQVTLSAWMRAAPGQSAIVRFDFEGASDFQSPDITLTQSWQRYSWTFAGDPSAAGYVLGFANGGVGATSTFIAWGPQIEIGATANGYVPVSATANGSTATLTPSSPFTLSAAPWLGQYIKSLGVQQYNYSVSTGSAAGASTASAVGTTAGGGTLTATGTAAGAATVSGVGAALLPSVATAAGVGTATGVGVGINATTGTAAGTSTASGVGNSGTGSTASAAGAATASGVGASTATSAGSAAGLGAALAVGAATDAATGTATGAATAAATGLGVAASVGTAAGASSASAGGVYALSGAGTSTGTSTATAGGASTATTTASAAGVSTASAIASPTDATTGTAAGTSTASAVGVAIGSGAGTASGTSTASATTAVTIAATGTAAGTSTAIAYTGTIGQAAGSSTVTAVGAATVAQAGSAAGSSTASALGTALTPGTASATGSAPATAIGASLAITVASAAGISTASALSSSGTGATASAAGSSTASAVGASIAASAATSAGSSTATAGGATLLAGSGSAAGSSTASAVGAFIQSTIATAAGLASASAIGVSTAAATGTAAGTSTATGLTGIVGTANGTSTATGVGAAIVASVTTAAGSSTATAVGQAVVPSTGTVTAASTASATGASTAASPASASGGATVSAVGQAIITSVASAAGAATASALGSYYLGSAGFSNGASTASSVGASVAASPGTANGSAPALGSGGYVIGVTAFAQGFAAAVAAGASKATATGTAAGTAVTYGYGLVYFPYVHRQLLGRINRPSLTGTTDRAPLTGRINRPSLTGISD